MDVNQSGKFLLYNRVDICKKFMNLDCVRHVVDAFAVASLPSLSTAPTASAGTSVSPEL